jgi:hypothetical protein
MRKPHISQMIFMLLILCLVSVWSAPVFLGIDTAAVEFTETDSDPFEFDEDLFLIHRGTGSMANRISFTIGGIHLNMLPASLTRVFSPPRFFSAQ